MSSPGQGDTTPLRTPRASFAVVATRERARVGPDANDLASLAARKRATNRGDCPLEPPEKRRSETQPRCCFHAKHPSGARDRCVMLGDPETRQRPAFAGPFRSSGRQDTNHGAAGFEPIRGRCRVRCEQFDLPGLDTVRAPSLGVPPVSWTLSSSGTTPDADTHRSRCAPPSRSNTRGRPTSMR